MITASSTFLCPAEALGASKVLVYGDTGRNLHEASSWGTRDNNPATQFKRAVRVATTIDALEARHLALEKNHTRCLRCLFNRERSDGGRGG